MQPSDFTNDSPGNRASIAPGVDAFVPGSPPEQLDLDGEAVRLLAAAERSLGQLSGILSAGRSTVSSQLVAHPLLRVEAISSSRIEGTVTTPEQLALFEVDGKVDDPNDAAERQTEEVLNYIRALDHGFKRLSEIPLCLRLIKELHSILMQSVHGTEITSNSTEPLGLELGPGSAQARSKKGQPEGGAARRASLKKGTNDDE